MKKFLIIAAAIASMASACQRPDLPEEALVQLSYGPVELQDMGFGMFYGNSQEDTASVFSIVLSDALCYQDKLGAPYMDSEGDMVVLQFRAPMLANNEKRSLPFGKYEVSDKGGKYTINSTESYVVRTIGTVQSTWALKSGTVRVTKGEKGMYLMTTKNLVLEKDNVQDTVSYSCFSEILIQDYNIVAPSMLSTDDDIIDMPFPYLSCVYYGDLYGNETGNFVLSMATQGFIEIDEEGNEAMTDLPGVYVVLNFFSKLYIGAAQPVIEAGRYEVSALSNEALYKRWSLFPGVTIDSTPFGSYLLQQPANGEGVMEYISSGYVDVEYPDADPQTKAVTSSGACIMTYNLKTASRTISGIWKGVMPISNLAEASGDVPLTTLDDDVECVMDKVTSGTLQKIETLHRKNIKEEWDYDIAEAWQLILDPRDWNAQEYAIDWVDSENPLGADGISGTEDDWMYDKNCNGIRDRLEAWCGDGDAMVLEFILPLDLNEASKKDEHSELIAPILNKTYTYTMQPDLALQHESYELYVSRMGRPVDEVFDERYAKDFKEWAEKLSIESYNRCNARRGFTWSEGNGLRGNWYVHYETGRHLVIDEHAPAINGWVKVTRTGEDTYNFQWDFVDDYPGTPNRITGSLDKCKVKLKLD